MAKADDYRLSRDSTESARLEAQYRVWNENLGYSIHPAINKNLPSSPRIADVGTGSGVFLLDQARNFSPSSQLDGFDISDAQFPSDAHQPVPSNVKFYVHDTRTRYAEEFRGKYDVVHLRLLVSALDQEDWRTVAANVVELLKPDGGAVQWNEANHFGNSSLRGASAIGARPDTLTMVSNHFHTALKDRLQHGFNDVAPLLRQNGLRDVVTDVVASDNMPHTRAEFSRVCFEGIYGWARQMCRKNAPNAWSMSEIEELKRKCDEEIASGCYHRFDFYVTIGFR